MTSLSYRDEDVQLTGFVGERIMGTLQELRAIDPHIPMADVDAFVEEMSEADADWQLIAYGGAVHGFTHKDAVPGAIPGVEYDARTDERSFAAARLFLAEPFDA